jgi:hypothetical protein
MTGNIIYEAVPYEFVINFFLVPSCIPTLVSYFETPTYTVLFKGGKRDPDTLKATATNISRINYTLSFHLNV